MTAQHWLGLICLIIVVGLAVFGFRQGLRVKPDQNRKNEDWPNITLGGPGG